MCDYNWCSPMTPIMFLDAGSVELRNAVAEKFGVELAATVTFDHPTVHALALQIASRLAPANAAVRPPAAAVDASQAVTATAPRIAAQLHAAVAGLLGYAVQSDLPLMEAGLDSIGGHNMLRVC